MGLDISLVRIIDHEADDLCHLFAEENPELLPFFRNYIHSKHFSFPDEEYDADVYFYVELAHQRRGMIPAFYDDFSNDICLTTWQEIERMADYVEPERKTDFAKLFVEQFAEGETVVVIGW